MSVDRQRYLSLDEVKHLRKMTKQWAEADMLRGRRQGPLAWMLVDFALSTGLRVSEIAAVEVKDIDAKRLLLTVARAKKREKTGRMVTDPATGQPKPEYRRKLATESLNIGADLVAHLQEFITTQRPPDPSDALWIGKHGPLTPQGLEVLWKSAVIRAGMTRKTNHPKAKNQNKLVALYSIHAARHTCATHLLGRTHNLRQVQKQLGHATPTVTANMYADVTDADMRAGIEGLYDQ